MPQSLGKNAKVFLFFSFFGVTFFPIFEYGNRPTNGRPLLFFLFKNCLKVKIGVRAKREKLEKNLKKIEISIISKITFFARKEKTT